MTQTDTPSSTQFLVEKAKGNLAQRFSIAITEINLVEAREVVWPNTSLGCPQEEVMYAQVVTEGFIITLEAGGIHYTYHTDTDKQVVSCERPQLPVFPVTPGDIDDGQPWIPVD